LNQCSKNDYKKGKEAELEAFVPKKDNRNEQNLRKSFKNRLLFGTADNISLLIKTVFIRDRFACNSNHISHTVIKVRGYIAQGLAKVIKSGEVLITLGTGGSYENFST
jgi:hypothetical protein